MTDYERGWRDGVKAARDYLRWIWDDGPQGNANDAAELTLLDTYGEKGPPSEPIPGGAGPTFTCPICGKGPVPQYMAHQSCVAQRDRPLRPASPSPVTRRCFCGKVEFKPGHAYHFEERRQLWHREHYCDEPASGGTRRGSNG